MRKILAAAAVAAIVVVLAAPQAATAAGAAFGAPVKVTPTGGFGYEPGIVTDPYGNIFATAHKENWQLLLAPDPNSPTYTRSMSWDWVSVDNGKTWTDIPGLSPASLEQHEFGDEGDMAVDDAHHLYFVDTNVTDVTFTRWTTSGRGLDHISLDFTRPVLPSISPLDDRPWVIAHGNGHVFYFGNDGTKFGDGGRYTVYPSYDGGQTFDPVGHVLPDSGWCRPAADHTAGSPYVYAICTNDTNKLWAYVSPDDGKTWNRYFIDKYNGDDASQSWPTAQVAANGSIWALYVNANQLRSSDSEPVTNSLILYHSTNHGQTWTRQDITPKVGRYDYGWISVSPDGKRLGLGVYYRVDNRSPWYVEGAIWSPGGKPTLTSLDPQHPAAPADHIEAPGDLMSSVFAPDGHLSVIWTRDVLTTDVATLERDIYTARSL